MLVPLLEKHGLTWEVFRKKGRPDQGVRDRRAALVTELHRVGTTWAEMMEITGLSNGAIQRLTQAMWNPESRKQASRCGRVTGASWKGKKRPGQLERQWQKGDFDRPETRAKYSATAVATLKKYPWRAYPRGIAEVVPTVKAGVPEIRVRSSYEKLAASKLDQDPRVLSYSYEQPVTLDTGRHILPDFIVTWEDHTCTIIEVKASWVLNDPRRSAGERRRLQAAEQVATARGWAFALWTEKELGLC
ncbi:MAG: hypothetical protein A2Y38_19460 [Spirochaetes bacterium GWB1_59_5]|nr:MAG: hypothetical protein A2Y38_19460 [Spirochaetes bacterium GWB1_59_5]